ncbi:hypothetical protein MAP00_005726 [Monascus purpureus]|nr:hypothetical protein MAP00_005726 [Monascus purpureus]
MTHGFQLSHPTLLTDAMISNPFLWIWIWIYGYMNEYTSIMEAANAISLHVDPIDQSSSRGASSRSVIKIQEKTSSICWFAESMHRFNIYSRFSSFTSFQMQLQLSFQAKTGWSDRQLSVRIQYRHDAFSIFPCKLKNTRVNVLAGIDSM